MCGIDYLHEWDGAGGAGKYGIRIDAGVWGCGCY